MTAKANTSNKKTEMMNEGFFDMLGEMGIGGNIVILILSFLSIYAIYIMIERYLAINKVNKKDTDFLEKIQVFVNKKDSKSAKELCENTDSPISRMIEKGVDRISKPMTDISVAIENQGKLEIYKREFKNPKHNT